MCNVELGVVVHTDDDTDYLPSFSSLYKATSGLKIKDYKQR